MVPSLACEEAVTAKVEAEARLQVTRDQWTEVTAVANRLAAMREKNHFAEMIRTAIIGGQ